MKTEIFGIWKPLVEEFLQDLTKEGVAYDELSDWMDNAGARLFRECQTQFYKENIETYSQDENYQQAFQLAKQQIEAGFQGVLNSLKEQTFPITAATLKQHAEKLLAACTQDKFHNYIATRGTMTVRKAKRDLSKPLNLEKDKKAYLQDQLEEMEMTLAEMKILKEAFAASLNSLESHKKTFLANLEKKTYEELVTTFTTTQPLIESHEQAFLPKNTAPFSAVIPRGPSSPVLHKAVAQTNDNGPKTVHKTNTIGLGNKGG